MAISLDTVSQIRELASQGRSISEISRKLHLGRPTARKYINNPGIEHNSKMQKRKKQSMLYIEDGNIKVNTLVPDSFFFKNEERNKNIILDYFVSHLNVNDLKEKYNLSIGTINGVLYREKSRAARQGFPIKMKRNVLWCGFFPLTKLRELRKS